MLGKTIEEIKVGDTAKFSKTVSESDVYLFAGVTGDLNPAHVSEDFAKDTFFKTRIAHGMLSASFRLKTYCINQEKTIVVDGEALVSPPRAPKSA